MKKQDFGGDWTEEKLDRVRKYLPAYTTIFNSNPKAKSLKTHYVDAFAGSGYRYKETNKIEYELFPELSQQDTNKFLKGSARIALEIEPSFNEYLFIDKDPQNVNELEKLKSEFPSKANSIKIFQADANVFLKEWVSKVDWKKCRAVVFLDPYGMDVEWSLIKSIANTKAIDLWILFPLGAVNRMLTKNTSPPQSWKDSLTKIFGTNDWENYFYLSQSQLPASQTNLFGEGPKIRDADFDKIKEYFIGRLEFVFTMVAKNVLILRNNNNVPLFMLCFAAGNPKGAPTAVKIANEILGK